MVWAENYDIYPVCGQRYDICGVGKSYDVSCVVVVCYSKIVLSECV